MPRRVQLENQGRIFNNLTGQYETASTDEVTLLYQKYLKGNGSFPYTFQRKYEACDCFSIFNHKQRIVNKENFSSAKYLKYTFGIEYETSCGYVPEDIAFRDGIIPLRDGSLTGLEYSTVILNGNSGLNLVKQQVNTLREHTSFNKECSLHMHFGGYPLRPDKVVNLYHLCYLLQSNLDAYVPRYTFKTAAYKSTGKDYCKRLPSDFKNINDLYYNFVGVSFPHTFFKPHPNDVTRSRKWEIPTRYYWINFVNFLCYDINKTIEFRFLRPTYNLEKISTWIFIFNAILAFAESNITLRDIDRMYENGELTLTEIVSRVYPRDFSEKLKINLVKLNILSKNQAADSDYIGANLMLEEELFDKNLII